MAAKIWEIRHVSETLYLRSLIPSGLKFAQNRSISNGFCDICQLLMLIANLTKSSNYSHTYSDRFVSQ